MPQRSDSIASMQRLIWKTDFDVRAADESDGRLAEEALKSKHIRNLSKRKDEAK